MTILAHANANSTLHIPISVLSQLDRLGFTNETEPLPNFSLNETALAHAPLPRRGRRNLLKTRLNCGIKFYTTIWQIEGKYVANTTL